MAFKEAMSPEKKKAFSTLENLIKKYDLNIGNTTANWIVNRALKQGGNQTIRTKILNVLSESKPEFANQIKNSKPVQATQFKRKRIKKISSALGHRKYRSRKKTKT